MPSNKSKQSSSAKKGHKNDVERKVYYMSPESYIGEGGSGKPEGGTGKPPSVLSPSTSAALSSNLSSSSNSSPNRAKSLPPTFYSSYLYHPCVFVKQITAPPLPSLKANSPPPPPSTVSMVKCLTDSSLHTVSSTSSLPPANPLDLTGVPDIMLLPSISEPALLHTLRTRYSRDEVYTTVGSVLISLNPYKWNKKEYDQTVMQKYNNKSRTDLPPHLFNVADKALSNLMEVSNNETTNGFNDDHSTGVNQSIIISGESGAGKTEATKLIMQYLATVTSTGEAATKDLSTRVLSANPLLESFGNARTLRNDNSSRFGKFIKIQFSTHRKIVGATISNYLLEKTRICKQEEGERNYHIFYQLITGASEELTKKLNLSPGVAGFNYLTSPKGQSKRDAKAYEDTQSCLERIGVSSDSQEIVFGLVAGVLHLGNIEFESEGEDDVKVKESSVKSLEIACDLIGLDREAVTMAVTKRKIVMNDATVYKPQSVTQAIDKRDALAKLVYESLFLWLVKQLNRTISASAPSSSSNAPSPVNSVNSADDVYGFIGVLDIYGFEHFDTNGFEQLLINYANESLQRHFNRHLFEVEQEEYAREGVDWTYISFNDNRPCLELIEGGSGVVGILQTLDDAWSGMGTSLEKDAKFVTQLHNSFGGRSNKTPKHKHFSTPRVGFDSQFVINHYAGEVKYTGTGFVEKNIETLSNELKDLGLSSTIPLAKEVFEAAKESGENNLAQTNQSQKSGRRGSRIRGVSVATQFRVSLNQLMVELDQTSPHYVRCVKPNLLKRPNALDSGEVLRQLRYAGMMETIRIRSEGYSLREEHETFFERFKILGEDTINMTAHSGGVEKLVESLSKILKVTDADWQVGHSKVFLRHQLADKLETLTRLRQIGAVRSIQKAYFAHRVWLAGALMVNWAKGRVTAMRFKKLKTAAMVLAACYRKQKEQSRFVAVQYVATRIQSQARRKSASRRVAKMRDPYGGLSYNELKAQLDEAEASLNEAIEKKDFEGAAKIEEGIGGLREVVEARRPMTRGLLEKLIVEVQGELEDAVKNKRFADCGPLQAKLDGLLVKRDELPTIAELEAKVKAGEEEVAAKSKARDFAGAAAAQKAADVWLSKLKRVKTDEAKVAAEMGANSVEEKKEEEEAPVSGKFSSRCELEIEISTFVKEVADAVADKKFQLANEKQEELSNLEGLRSSLLSCKELKAQLNEAKGKLSKAIEAKEFADATALQETVDKLELKYSEEKKIEVLHGKETEVKVVPKKKSAPLKILSAHSGNKGPKVGMTAVTRIAGTDKENDANNSPNLKKKELMKVKSQIKNANPVSKLRPKKPLIGKLNDSILSVCQMMSEKRHDAALIVGEDGGLA
ncbi:hypothetical protein TrVE_jg1382, partial [Triparma verrucosa]